MCQTKLVKDNKKGILIKCDIDVIHRKLICNLKVAM